MLSTKEAQRHTPSWCRGDGAPVYLVRAGSVIERAMVEAELAGEHQAGRVFAFELLAAYREGVRALADDGDRDHLIAIAEAEAVLEGADGLPPDEAVLLADARAELAKYWPSYRALLAKIARRKEVAPIIALRRFLVGWENVALPFARGADGLVPLELLARLDPLEMLSAGNHAYGLLYPSEDLEGNSPRPSQSDESPQPSRTSGSSAKPGGKSPGGGGRKTRG